MYTPITVIVTEIELILVSLNCLSIGTEIESTDVGMKFIPSSFLSLTVGFTVPLR